MKYIWRILGNEVSFELNFPIFTFNTRQFDTKDVNFLTCEIQDRIKMSSGSGYSSCASSSDTSTTTTSDNRINRSSGSDDQNQQNLNNRQPSSREASRLLGTVKWFNAKAGYGFITRQDNGEDVFVHLSGIARQNPRHAFKSLGDGEIVEFNTMATNVTGKLNEIYIEIFNYFMHNFQD